MAVVRVHPILFHECRLRARWPLTETGLYAVSPSVACIIRTHHCHSLLGCTAALDRARCGMLLQTSSVVCQLVMMMSPAEAAEQIVMSFGCWLGWAQGVMYSIRSTHTHNRFTTLFLGPPGWAGARRELLDFMVQGKINRGRHTDHLAGRQSIRTNHCPPPPDVKNGWW